MSKHIITWCRTIHGDISVEAETASDAKEMLASMKNEDLVKSSSIWQTEEPVSVENVSTDLGDLDEETWEIIYGD